jgi:uncharacterized protein YndB with AHSA1/START domain
MDLITAIDAVQRDIADAATPSGDPGRKIVAERSYPATVDDVWDALTNPERIPRWFLPISGDLRLGGRYQLEGNAGGTITTCDPPAHLAVTWEFNGGTSWVDVQLTPSGDDTTLRLEHVAPVDAAAEEFWDEYGPGAVGVGWDLTLLGLGEHLATGAKVNGDPTDPALLDCMRRSSAAWGRASAAYGTPADQAEAAAERTTAFYTGG